MLTTVEVRELAQARLDDARVLAANGRSDGAVYMSGYAVELALKAAVSAALNLPGFPETDAEFDQMRLATGHWLKTHDFDDLLALSGHEAKIKANHLSEWSIVATWDPEVRYKRVGSASLADAGNMIGAAEVIRQAL